MKPLKSLLSLMLVAISVTMFAQTYTLTCHKNDLVDKAANCVTCPNADELFTGLAITRPNGSRQKIYAPFKFKTYGESVNIRDAYGNGATINVNNIATYDTMPTLLTFLEGCSHLQTNGAFYVTSGTAITAVDSLSDVSGWSFPVDSGDIYLIELSGASRSANDTCGIFVGAKFSGTATFHGDYWAYLNAAGSVSTQHGLITTIASTYSKTNGGYTTTVAAAPATSYPIFFKGVLKATADGTVQFGWGKEMVTAGVAYINAGTTITYRKLN